MDQDNGGGVFLTADLNTSRGWIKDELRVPTEIVSTLSNRFLASRRTAPEVLPVQVAHFPHDEAGHVLLGGI